MQVERRRNVERSRETMAALLDAARDLFVAHGFAGTSTPAIVRNAGTTRGALYHHFADKKAIFQAVVDREASEVARAIAEREAVATGTDTLSLLLDGADSYFDAMTEPGRTMLLLIEGPAILGQEVMARIDAEHAAGSLLEGVTALLHDGDPPRDPGFVEAQTDLLSAAFDRAALAIAAGKTPEVYRRAIRTLIEGLAKTGDAMVETDKQVGNRH